MGLQLVCRCATLCCRVTSKRTLYLNIIVHEVNSLVNYKSGNLLWGMTIPSLPADIYHAGLNCCCFSFTVGVAVWHDMTGWTTTEQLPLIYSALNTYKWVCELQTTSEKFLYSVTRPSHGTDTTILKNNGPDRFCVMCIHLPCEYYHPFQSTAELDRNSIFSFS